MGDQYDTHIFRSKETRKVLRLVYDLFKATIDHDIYTLLYTRTKLRIIALTKSTNNNNHDPKLYKLQSWYYLGLHYDVLSSSNNNKDNKYKRSDNLNHNYIIKSKYCMKKALEQTLNKSLNGGDIMKILPLLHMTIRNWFDDEEISSNISNDNYSNNNYDNDILNDRIRNDLIDDCMEVKVVDLKHILRSRGFLLKGSKIDIVYRVVDFIMDEINHNHS